MQLIYTDSGLAAKLAQIVVAAEKRKEIFDAAGQILVAMAQRSHTDAASRPAPWAPLADGTASRLFDKGHMRHGEKVLSSTADGVTVGDSVPYGAIHQEGGRTGPRVIRAKNAKALKTPFGPRKSVKHPGSKIPARPRWPVIGGKLTPRAEVRISGMIARKLGL